jgi:hypothetical protein
VLLVLGRRVLVGRGRTLLEQEKVGGLRFASFGFSFVPRCAVAATHTTLLESDRKASFSAAKRTVLDDALGRLKIHCLEHSAPDVEAQLFEAYCWNTDGTAADGSPLFRLEDRETTAITDHLNRLLLRIGCNRFLADVRQKKLFVNVIDGGHSHVGKLDLALFTDAVPARPSFDFTIGAIDIKTPLRMSQTSETSPTAATTEQPGTRRRRPSGSRAPVGVDVQAKFEVLGLTLAALREGIPLLVSDFSTAGCVFIMQDSMIIEYVVRVTRSDGLVTSSIMDAHTAWNVWLHLGNECANKLQEVLRPRKNVVLEAIEEFGRLDEDEDDDGEDDDDSDSSYHPPRGRSHPTAVDAQENAATSDNCSGSSLSPVVCGNKQPLAKRTRRLSDETTLPETVSMREINEHFAREVLRRAMRGLVR